MTRDLRMDKDRMEKLVALVLREEGEAPGEASLSRFEIISRIEASQSTPDKPGLRGHRMIPQWLPFEKRDEFTDDVARYLDDVTTTPLVRCGN